MDGGMARREYKLTKRCAHEGCKEIGRWTYETVRDLQNSFYQRNDYRCTRHTDPESVLSLSRRTTEVVLTSKSSDKAAGLYWAGSSGFCCGPGFRAWADDFPEGARLIVTARLELPAEAQAGSKSQ